jgi:transposase
MPRSRPRRTRIRLLATERAELERRVAARTSTQQDAYRAEIILRVAAGQTDAAIAHDMGLAVRTVFVWRHRFAEQRVDGLKDRPKCPPPRQYHADIQARLLVLASDNHWNGNVRRGVWCWQVVAVEQRHVLRSRGNVN